MKGKAPLPKNLQAFPPPEDDFAFIFIAGEPVRLTIQDFRIDNEARTQKKVYLITYVAQPS